MEKLTVCWARALAAALNSDSVRMSLPRKKSYSKRIKMKWTKKKVWPSPHLALVCISLPIDSTVRLILGIDRLIFWYSSSRRGRHLPALCTMTPLLMVRWWISIVGIPKSMIYDISLFLPGYAIHYYPETCQGWVEDCVPILMENSALDTLP